ncbi:E3 ubiquitin-protein ligase TRIM33-like [Dendronephthya gigantea]|uniref:E3 ubiquitin-protein ligase TRIM33-like n=1 Tax=Dendronephthya gigantea TaxID=151771 RepID=UPI00106919C2|nr:E3 ubiquitin-protein ligase TRIM33-like [Dendronephthya gigantea]
MSVDTVEIDGTSSPVVVEEKGDESLPKFCSICTTGFDKVVPKLLPCLHSFCQACLEDRLQDDQASTSTMTPRASTSRLKCPKCGQEFLVPSRGVASLIDNQFILEIVTKPCSSESESEQHVCTSCEDNSTACSYCLNCSEWLCSACVQAHQRVRITKDHEIKSGDDLRASVKSHSRNERSLYCQKHPSEKLKLFCIKCERLTCRDCQLLEHKDHQYQFVNEAAGRYRDFFKKRLKSLEDRIMPLAESIEAVHNSSTHLDHKSEIVANEIRNSSNEIIKAVKQRELTLLNELQALVHFKRKMLNKQSKDLNLMQEILKHNYEFTKHAVYQGSDTSLLTSQRQLGSRIQNLLSLKYRVTPVAHSDLKFVTEAVKLCNAILKAGSVMTPSSQRSSLNGANMTRNPNIPSHQNGSHSTMKVNPLHSLNTFTNRPGIQAATGINPKPSSKVYPNVITSQIAMPIRSGGVCSTTLPYASVRNTAPGHSRSNAIPVSIASASQPFPSSPQIHSVSSRRLTNPDVPGVPLRHAGNSVAGVPSSSPPNYDASVRTMRKSSSSSTLELTSSQTSNINSILTNISREVRRDNPISSSHSTEHNSSLLSATLTRNQSSPSPLSPSLPKPSPSPSHSSMSPSQSSPRPLLSPTSSNIQPSPVPSPLPTFLSMDFREASGIKIKTEKDQSPQASCTAVKPEPGLHGSCSFSSGKGIPDLCACGPPSNNSSNEDWCAVCHNGGELLCCDTCPKVFHLNCHVPSLTSTPSDSWSCGLCESLDGPTRKHTGAINDLICHRCSNHAASMVVSFIGTLLSFQFQTCEKMLLALFCHPDSIPFQDKVSKAVPNYYKVIQKPMDLSSIKAKLQPVHFEHYKTVSEFIADCQLVFSNCAVFNDAESEVGKMGKRLAADFQNIIRQYADSEENYEPAMKKRREDNI